MKMLMKDTVIFSELSKFLLMSSIIPYSHILFNEIIQFTFYFSKVFFIK